LTPVVELSPSDYSTRERPSPSGSGAEDPAGWLAYWSDCLADSGIVDLTPWPGGTFWVPVHRLTDPALAVVIRCLLEDVREDADPDEIPPLAGGFALTGPDGEVFEPGCCSDLGGLEAWAGAAACTDPGWTMVWTGHPWRAVRERDGVLELSEPTEESISAADGPALAVAARIERDALVRAVAAARSECDRFAARLAAALTTGPAATARPSGVSIEQTAAALLGLPG